MNALRRALQVFASSATATERLVLHPTTFILQSYATAATRRTSKPLRTCKTFDKSSLPSKDVAVSERPRPTEIPYQPKVANFVNLIGHVQMPVQFQTSPDGKTLATTVITRELSPDISHLWIPVIFEGDLAHVAACHLKENDCIHIAGELSAGSSYLNENQGQSNVQVLAQSLNFVQGYPLMKSISAVSKQQEISNSSASAKDNSASLLSSWRDLLEDPKQWWDCRDSKHNGSVNSKYPDFKRKDGSLSLWLNKAPKWVLSELKGLEFDVLILKSKQAKEHKGDGSWRDVVENPDKWWDNRSNKRNKRAPDFKHKESGEGLWLDSSPSWVLPKLPPLKAETSRT